MSARLRRRGRALALLVGGLVAVSVVGADGALGDDGNARHLTLHFTKTVGLYSGAQLRILGVPVGKIDSLTPEGGSVEVRATVTKDVKIPAAAQAYIEIPALVSDRYVELAPAYTGGAALPDGADIPLSRTHTPVEKDDIEASLTQLANALGPDGANKNGSLTTLLHAGAQTLAGNGDDIRQTLDAVSQLVTTLDDNKGAFTGTVDQLDDFVKYLADDDSGIRQLFADLQQTSGELAGDRTDLAGALKSLGTATGEIAQFIDQNKDHLSNSVNNLLDTSNVLVQDKKALAETLDDAPLALTNVAGAYDPATQTLDTRDNLTNALSDPTYLCTVLQGFGLEDSSGKLLGLLDGPTCTASGSTGAATGTNPLGSLLGGLTQTLTPSTKGATASPAPAPSTPAPAPASAAASSATTGTNPLGSLLGGLLGGSK